jgi:16S rRNA (adenine1518-N6/adenine1519-N6)-dimethyltransferase
LVTFEFVVRPKKSLGQHFLTDVNISRRISDAFQPASNTVVVEIGPGTGALTRFLLERNLHPVLIEIDRDSVAYLKEHLPPEKAIIRETDFLETGFDGIGGDRIALIGNFPYNISSQIFFKVLENRGKVDLVVGMIQKEVAQRIAAPPGNRTYGILSVLLQAYYSIKILFHVPPGVFHPPPKVMSSVIRLERNNTVALDCDEELFFKVVKRAFQTRRKTLRNALKDLHLPSIVYTLEVMDKRAEQLSVADFVELIQKIQAA